MFNVNILGGGGKKTAAKVSHHGEVIVAPYDYSSLFYASTVSTTGEVIVPAKAKWDFVLTSFWIYCSVGTNVTIDIYEANPVDIGTSILTIAAEEMSKKGRFIAPATLNLKVDTGKSIAVKVSAGTFNVTVLGYYIET